MSIQKYTNFENINNNSENTGQFLESKDLFIVSKNELQIAEFGNTPYDVMEVSIYDDKNKLLKQKNGMNVAYIKSTDIKNYIYNITNYTGKKELAINVEKLLNDLGFQNGVYKVNLNFVRNRVGSDNETTRVWIHEISPSREEIRILPLKTNNEATNNLTKLQFKNLKALNKDFIYYKTSILNTISSFDNAFLTKVDDYLFSQYGKEYINVVKKDFGVKDFEGFKKRIFEDFKNSVIYYLTNKGYDVTKNNFGNPSEIRFYDYEQYDYASLTIEINNILRNCIKANSVSNFKRRDIIFS